uniref:Potassium channel blocker pMeKTx26-2 n=1 Tax=Mesobuthus eupeus TaxID=34648 RepID=A0A088D9P7_MESEU|nr:potassium channel blocker pMeKTx26-2 [Mesobuthus eupeus]
MNNYFKIVLIMAAFFVVTITFSNIQVEAGCDWKKCQKECTGKKVVGMCMDGECTCVSGQPRQKPGRRMAEW